MSGALARCDRFRPGLLTEDPAWPRGPAGRAGRHRGRARSARGGVGGPPLDSRGLASKNSIFQGFNFQGLRSSRIRNWRVFKDSIFKDSISRIRIPEVRVLENSNPWNLVSKDSNSRDRRRTPAAARARPGGAGAKGGEPGPTGRTASAHCRPGWSHVAAAYPCARAPAAGRGARRGFRIRRDQIKCLRYRMSTAPTHRHASRSADTPAIRSRSRWIGDSCFGVRAPQT